MLNKAHSAIVEQTNKEKFIGSETFPMASEDLDEAKDIIENCFQQLLQLSTRSKNRNQIYHAGIQMFQLNKKKKKDLRSIGCGLYNPKRWLLNDVSPM